MKIGDQFKQDSFPYVYSLVTMGFTNKVYMFSTTDNAIMSCFSGNVKDAKNITKEEFCAILQVSPERMTHYKKLDGSPLFPEETYRYGDIFEIIAYPTNDDSVGQKLMLCQVDTGKYCLITIDGFSLGNRWENPIAPKNNLGITKEELKQMCGVAQSVVLKRVNE